MRSSIDKQAVLVYTVKKGEEKINELGHTLLQKLFYLLQHAEGVSLGYKFKLHYYGPYSPELWSDLNHLSSSNMLSVTADPRGFGYKISTTSSSDRILEYYNYDYDESIDKLLELLGDQPVRVLESLATTHYVYADVKLKNGDFKKECIINKVIALKPHLGKDEVAKSIEMLDKNSLII